MLITAMHYNISSFEPDVSPRNGTARIEDVTKVTGNRQ